MAAGLAIVVLVSIMYVVHPRSLWMGQPEDLVAALYTIVVCYALITGATLVATEVDSGTVVELFARPIDPLKIWLSKVLFGLFTIYALYFVAELLGVAAVIMREKEVSVDMLTAGDTWNLPNAVMFALPAEIFAIALFASTLATHAIVAVLGAVALAVVHGSLVLFVYAIMFRQMFGHLAAFPGRLGHSGFEIMLSVFMWLGWLIYFPLSAHMFRRGQIQSGLKLPKWREAARCLGIMVLIQLSPHLAVLPFVLIWIGFKAFIMSAMPW